jgi:chromate transporter
MALWIGYSRRGFLGGLIAGLCFLTPGFLLILLIAVFYDGISHTHILQIFISGMRTAALVVIIESMVRMFQPFSRLTQGWVFAFLGAALMMLFPRWEPLVILSCGLAAITGRSFLPKLSLSTLFWTHFKAGAFTFGTGLAIVPLLQHEAVDVYRWVGTREFLDGIAFGQITPGPITLTSAFIGFRADGFLGAIAAASGIYLPGTIIILGVMPFFFSRISGSSVLCAFSSGAIPAVIGCIAYATLLMAQDALVSSTDWVICIFLIAVNRRLGISGWKLILLGAVVSLFLQLTRGFVSTG